MNKDIYLAGGCFWGTEALLQAVEGVTETKAGYANGNTEYPTYQQVCTGATGHAETVLVRYDTERTSLNTLLSWYFRSIDPFAVNRQGPDCGTQYRTGVYYTDPADRSEIESVFRLVEKELGKAVAVELMPLSCFYPAEDYHQKYLKKNPAGYCHVPRSLIAEARYRPLRIKDSYPMGDTDSLSPMAKAVLFHGATEPPYSHPEWNSFEEGIYVDAATGEPLFASADKFYSECGWPSFSKPILPEVVSERTDRSHDMIRTEVRSRSGDLHLGHVFDEPAGRRYCINGSALRFIPKDKMEQEGYGDLLSAAK